MSRIDDLLAELCPNGVEFKALGEVGSFIRGSGLQKKDFTETGVGCVHYGQIYTFYGTSASSTRSFISPELAERLKKATPGDLIVTTTSENIEDVCKAVAWLGEQEIAIGGHSCVYRHDLDPLFVAYYFQSEAFQIQKRKFVAGTKVKDIRLTDLARIRVPVPPRALQRAVAEFLGRFERLEADLEAELKAERKARASQYAHYREVLLTFAGRDDVPWAPMGEVGMFFRGRRFTKADYVEEGVPAIHYGEIYTRYGTSATAAYSHVRPELADALRFAGKGDVVVAVVGETVEDVGKAVAWLGEEDVAIHDDCFAYRHEMDAKFVAHFFQTERFHGELARHVARAKVKRISGKGLAEVRIPVVPLEEQQRIVSILDELEATVHDLSAGLPAEIAARRKQYEHYRDLLLTFPEETA